MNKNLIFIVLFAILLGLFNCYQLSQMKKDYNEKIEKFADTQAVPSSFSATTVAALQSLADGIVAKNIILPGHVSIDGSLTLTNNNINKKITDQGIGDASGNLKFPTAMHNGLIFQDISGNSHRVYANMRGNICSDSPLQSNSLFLGQNSLKGGDIDAGYGKLKIGGNLFVPYIETSYLHMADHANKKGGTIGSGYNTMIIDGPFTAPNFKPNSVSSDMDDMTAIRTLAQVAKSLQDGTGLVIPGNLTVKGILRATTINADSTIETSGVLKAYNCSLYNGNLTLNDPTLNSNGSCNISKLRTDSISTSYLDMTDPGNKKGGTISSGYNTMIIDGSFTTTSNITIGGNLTVSGDATMMKTLGVTGTLTGSTNVATPMINTGIINAAYGKLEIMGNVKITHYLGVNTSKTVGGTGFSGFTTAMTVHSGANTFAVTSGGPDWYGSGRSGNFPW